MKMENNLNIDNINNNYIKLYTHIYYLQILYIFIYIIKIEFYHVLPYSNYNFFYLIYIFNILKLFLQYNVYKKYKLYDKDTFFTEIHLNLFDSTSNLSYKTN